MPRSAALIADEMGLGKTVQVILSLRLLISSGMLKRALVVCPKPLVINWTRELRTWAPDLAFEVFSGDTETCDRWPPGAPGTAPSWKVILNPIARVLQGGP